MVLPPQKKKSDELGSPIGQWHLPSVNSRIEQRCPIGMMFSISAGSGSSSGSQECHAARAVFPRTPGRAIRIRVPGDRGLRWRGTATDGLLARPDRASRCTFPITELREMPPSSAAIWLADNPSLHSFLRSSTRSSVQFMASRPWPRAPLGRIPTCPPDSRAAAVGDALPRKHRKPIRCTRYRISVKERYYMG